MSLFVESRFSKFSFLLSILTIFFPAKILGRFLAYYISQAYHCAQILLLLLPTFSEYSLGWETSMTKMCLYLVCIYFTVLMFYSGSCTDSVSQTSYWATRGFLQKDLTNKELWQGKMRCSLASLVLASDMRDKQDRCKIILGQQNTSPSNCMYVPLVAHTGMISLGAHRATEQNTAPSLWFIRNHNQAFSMWSSLSILLHG